MPRVRAIGPVTVTGGVLAGSSVGGSVAGAVTVQSGAEIMPGGVNAPGAPLSLDSSLTMQAGSLLSFVFGARTSATAAQVQAAGALSLPTGADSVTVDITKQGNLYQVTPLFTFSSLTNGTASLASLQLGTTGAVPAGYSFVLDSSLGSLGSGNPNQIDLYDPNITNPVSLVWNAPGASGTWDTNAANTVWKAGGTSVPFTTGGTASFLDVSGATSGVVTITSSGVQPGTVIVSNKNTSYTFTGGPIAGFTSLTTGGGMTTLAATNSYTGGTYVTGGTLVAAAGDGSLGNSPPATLLGQRGHVRHIDCRALVPPAAYTLPRPAAAPTPAVTFNTNGLNSTLYGNVIVGNAERIRELCEDRPRPAESRRQHGANRCFQCNGCGA